MIPCTLQLKNFLSYGSELQTISFEPYHLICLSGKNGHGKSALLDAMTWALWGNARKVSSTARAEQGLLRLGQTHMVVIFDCEVNGTMYRVKREHEVVYGKPKTSLEFGVFKDDKTLTPLTDKTLRATQKVIETTIGLDFDTFVNSAFLRQGNANEFTKRSPKDRKEIITTILGLGAYELLRKAASEKVKEAGIHQRTLHALQEKINSELEQTNTLSLQKKEIETQLQVCIKTNETLEKKLQECTQKQHLYTELQQLTHMYNEHIVKLKTLRATWRATHQAQLNTPDISKLEKQKQTLITALETHQQTQQKLLTLKEKILTTQQTVNTHSHAITQAEHVYTKQADFAHERLKLTFQTKVQEKEKGTAIIKEHSKEIAILTQQIIDTEKNITDYSKSHAKHVIYLQQFEKRKESYQRLVAQGNMLHTELRTITQKMELTHDINDPSCPLCEQNLSATRRRFLHAKLTKQTTLIQHRYNRLKRVLPTIKQALVEQHKVVQKHTSSMQECATLKATLKTYRNKKIELETHIINYKKRITALSQDIENLEKQIKANSAQKQKIETPELNIVRTQYTQAQKEHDIFIQQSKKITYNAEKHNHIKKELHTIEQQLQTHADIQQHASLQKERAQNIHQLIIQLKQLKKEKEKLTQKLQITTSVEESYKKLQTQEQELINKRFHEYQKKETLLQEKGRLISEHKKREQLIAEHATQEKKIKELSNNMYDYQAIAHAASKDGIQALLIEDALPEIEQEANDILAKLTNNQAHVIIESLRDLKKGGTKETLEIKISDPSGIRPYELFSGGEAFRIDFALRIAISKLLARRAGTALQTLIIDEGFGSQDEEGLAHIMDAIYQIQDDFAKVIIVSHLPSMKDQFPIHFVVEKGASGSIVHVVEQG